MSIAPVAPRLLTVEEVAARLRLSKTTVYRLIERRVIPFYRYPGAVRILDSDVRAYLRARRVEPVDMHQQPYGNTQDS